MSTAVLLAADGVERRARLLPWGIEIQVWRLVETVTCPAAAGALSLGSLLSNDSPLGVGPRIEGDEETLENLVEDGPGEGDTHGV